MTNYSFNYGRKKFYIIGPGNHWTVKITRKQTDIFHIFIEVFCQINIYHFEATNLILFAIGYNIYLHVSLGPLHYKLETIRTLL
jgi:hypothetical protein